MSAGTGAIQSSICRHHRRTSRNRSPEQFGRIAETIVARREPVHDVVGDVVEEDPPISNTAEKVEPEIAALGRQNDSHTYVPGR